MKPIIKLIYKHSRFKNSEILQLIFNSFSKDWYARYGVALNPSTPNYILEFLSKDENEDVRSYFAQNPKSSSSTLDYLSKDKNETVRYHVSQNPTYKKYNRLYFLNKFI